MARPKRQNKLGSGASESSLSPILPRPAPRTLIPVKPPGFGAFQPPFLFAGIPPWFGPCASSCSLPSASSLAACGRPLTEAEAAYMADLQGEKLRRAPRPHRPEPRDRPRHPQLSRAAPDHLPRTDLAAARRPDDRGAHRGHRAVQHHARAPEFYLPDYVTPREGRRSLAAAMFFAHEMTHVWQWQNRAVTAYHPFRAFSEHVRIEDPYLFDPQDARANSWITATRCRRLL
jgi:hypothetical protein